MFNRIRTRIYTMNTVFYAVNTFFEKITNAVLNEYINWIAGGIFLATAAVLFFLWNNRKSVYFKIFAAEALQLNVKSKNYMDKKENFSSMFLIG